jgi:hypothetical protein
MIFKILIESEDKLTCPISKMSYYEDKIAEINLTGHKTNIIITIFDLDSRQIYEIMQKLEYELMEKKVYYEALTIYPDPQESE